MSSPSKVAISAAVYKHENIALSSLDQQKVYSRLDPTDDVADVLEAHPANKLYPQGNITYCSTQVFQTCLVYNRFVCSALVSESDKAEFVTTGIERI
jgi:hypothetical protein